MHERTNLVCLGLVVLELGAHPIAQVLAIVIIMNLCRQGETPAHSTQTKKKTKVRELLRWQEKLSQLLSLPSFHSLATPKLLCECGPL